MAPLSPFVTVDIHEEVYWKKSILGLLWVVWILGWCRSTLLHRLGFFLEMLVVGLCGGVFLSFMVFYYLLRKIPQLGFRKRTVLVVLAVGGMSAVVDLLVLLSEQVAWMLDTQTPFLHWRVYLMSLLGLAWVICSVSFRFLLPTRILQAITTHSIDGCRLVLLGVALWQHAEATCVTVVVYTLLRCVLSVWLFWLWIRYDPLEEEEKEKKRKKWREHQRFYEQEKRTNHHTHSTSKKRGRGRKEEEVEEEGGGAHRWQDTERKKKDVEWKWGGSPSSSPPSTSSTCRFSGSSSVSRNSSERDTDATTSSCSSTRSSAMLAYVVARGSQGWHRLRESTSLSGLLNTARRSSSLPVEPLSKTFRRRFSYRSESGKHFTLLRVLLRWTRRVVRRLMAILQHSLDDLDSEEEEEERSSGGMGKATGRTSGANKTKKMAVGTLHTTNDDEEEEDPLEVRKRGDTTREHPPSKTHTQKRPSGRGSGEGQRHSMLPVACLSGLHAVATTLERWKHPRRYRHPEWFPPPPSPSHADAHARFPHPRRKEACQAEEDAGKAAYEKGRWREPSEAVDGKMRELLAWRRYTSANAMGDPRSHSNVSPSPQRPRRHAENGTYHGDEHDTETIWNARSAAFYSGATPSALDDGVPVVRPDDCESFLSSSSSDSEESEIAPQDDPKGFFASPSSWKNGGRSPQGVYCTPTSSSFYRYDFKRKNKPSTEAYFKNSINDPLEVFPPYAYGGAGEASASRAQNGATHRTFLPGEDSPFGEANWRSGATQPTNASSRTPRWAEGRRGQSRYAYQRETEEYTKNALEQLAKHIRSQKDLNPLISRLRRPNEVLQWAERAAPSSSDDDMEA